MHGCRPSRRRSTVPQRCICAPARRFELVPLGELGGRPRVDCLCNMSGIFRDSFQNVVELLDDLFQRAAAADEPSDSNFIRCPGLFKLKTT